MYGPTSKIWYKYIIIQNGLINDKPPMTYETRCIGGYTNKYKQNIIMFTYMGTYIIMHDHSHTGHIHTSRNQRCAILNNN